MATIGSLILAMLLVAISGGIVCAGFPTYSIRELGLPPSLFDAGAINDRGQAAFATTYPRGILKPDRIDELFFFDGSKVHELPTPGGTNAWLFDLNNAGTIVGAEGICYLFWR
jgi:hypothetical protein